MFIKANYISTAVEARADSVLQSCRTVRIIARGAPIIMRTRVSGLTQDLRRKIEKAQRRIGRSAV
jgi:hypothetical protein